MTTVKSLSIGEVVAVPTLLGFVNHVGVVVGPDHVLQNTPTKGEHITTVRDFSKGQPVRVISARINPKDVIERARRVLNAPQPYDIFTNNCEHTTNRVLTGSPFSPQLAFWVILGSIMAGIAIAKNR